ncbi:MAG: hypothetical protein Dbin4_02860, partial [Alphaproteobacteria bacterium]|nr:hypothetical protein [Alphaproteobacteria bacterium]
MTRNRLLTTRNPELAQSSTPPVIAVVIPCFRVTQAILGVLSKIGDEVSMIFVIDDKCPDGSGRMVREQVSDPRVQVIFHEENLNLVSAEKIEGEKQKNRGDDDVDPRIGREKIDA